MHRFSEFIRHLAESAQHFAEQLGGPGLVAIAFLDSSFLTLPEVADLLVVVFTIREPEQWLYFAAMTTIGSVAGCYALYGWLDLAARRWSGAASTSVTSIGHSRGAGATARSCSSSPPSCRRRCPSRSSC